MNEFVFDPRVFISPPYTECPYCGRMSFGVLMIRKDYYTRRCRECMRPTGYESAASYPLPPVSKRVLYLDQSVISDMMKALNPEMNAHKQGRVDPFWHELFVKLDRLSGCPNCS